MSGQAISRAMRILAARAQSEWELAGKLARAGFDPAAVEGALSRLRELGYVDDASFARQWVEERCRLRPAGRRLLSAELSRKGVSAGHIEMALGPYGHEAELRAARALAQRAYERYAGLPSPERARRCYAYLIGRGFDHETAQAAAGGGDAPGA